MKYLKIFDNYTNSYYIKIDSKETFNRICDNSDIKPFSETEFSIISNIMSDINWDSRLASFMIGKKEYTRSVILISCEFNYIRIIKLEDEWYLVNDYLESENFKCDQFDGLLKCLEMIKNKV